MQLCFLGPGRSELKRMEQYINQAAEDQSSQPPSSSSSNQQQSSSPPSSSKPFGSIGMMRMPGRGGRRVDPRLVPGVGDETIEASLLGDLAVLTITDESHQVCITHCIIHTYNVCSHIYGLSKISVRYFEEYCFKSLEAYPFFFFFFFFCRILLSL